MQPTLARVASTTANVFCTMQAAPAGAPGRDRALDCAPSAHRAARVPPSDRATDTESQKRRAPTKVGHRGPETVRHRDIDREFGAAPPEHTRLCRRVAAVAADESHVPIGRERSQPLANARASHPAVEG
eukprot:3923268-Pleurochrysis_carterae.AAC.1